MRSIRADAISAEGGWDLGVNTPGTRRVDEGALRADAAACDLAARRAAGVISCSLLLALRRADAGGLFVAVPAPPPVDPRGPPPDSLGKLWRRFGRSTEDTAASHVLLRRPAWCLMRGCVCVCVCVGVCVCVCVCENEEVGDERGGGGERRRDTAVETGRESTLALYCCAHVPRQALQHPPSFSSIDARRTMHALGMHSACIQPTLA